MLRSVKLLVAAAFVPGLVLLGACGSSTDPKAGGSDGTGNANGPGGPNDSFGGNGGNGGPGDDAGNECAAQEAQATVVKRPVDIIFTIDNSGSMSDEIAEVQTQVNQNFTNIIDAAGVDYHVILISRHGANSSQSVCISAPLSGTNCAPVPTQPAETAKFFHYSVEIASQDAWCKILTTFDKADEFNLHPNGWGELLRPDAFKVFVTISDDRINTSCSVNGSTLKFQDQNTIAGATAAAEAFDAALLARSPAQFGTAAQRNYVHHAIAGFDWAEPTKTKAWPATDPINEETCGDDSENPGKGHQAIAKLTGGLRFPSCDPNYTAIFQEIAKGVVAGAKVACEFDIPDAPPGETLDLNTVVSRYTPGNGGAPVDFGQVANAAACAPNKFYIENDKIKLCPEACTLVQSDEKAQMKILFGCAVAQAK